MQAKASEVERRRWLLERAPTKPRPLANNAVHRVDTLSNAVANLDNYRPVAETSVHFGFNKDNLTKKAKEALDQMGPISRTPRATSSRSKAARTQSELDYNYDLSQRRADAVIQYLASQHNVPAHKIYLIGLGKDKPVESNKTATVAQRTAASMFA